MLKSCQVSARYLMEDGGASDTVLEIATNDSNGLEFPDDLTIPISGVEVSWDGAAATILNLTGMGILSDPLTLIPLGIRLTFDDTLPAAGTALTIMVPSTGTQTVTQDGPAASVGSQARLSGQGLPANYIRNQ